MRRFKKLMLKMLVLILSLLAGTLAAGVVFWHRHVADPGHHVTRENILQVMSQESPVYHRDGASRIGVFFSSEHRHYVLYDEIPEACVQAVVAAEDERFFSHHGVDPRGILRAMVQNVRAGRLVAGGSTLTQQTAKNVFYRPDRSLRSKWVELVDALRLEAAFTKEDILEFYFNQFHVSGNGRGLGVAARYFFDRDVQDLDLHQCAFIAGMVKAPAHYNPWTGRTEEAQAAAREKARERTSYVLRRLAETGSITEEARQELSAREVPFKRGVFRYERSVLLDAVEARLGEYPFPEIMADLGIGNPSTAGLKVVTTIDRGAQDSSTWALWHHLTELGGYLEGATLESFLLAPERGRVGPMAEEARRWGFYPARVEGTSGEGSSLALELDLGGTPGAMVVDDRVRCRVDRAGLERVATVIQRAALKNHYARPREEDVRALAEGLTPGSVVWASVSGAGEEDGGVLSCHIELRPELQGALVVLERGEVRAMVGGNDNQNFNRATKAARQFGSTWKPLVYHAALQLGWRPDDLLDNRRSVFPFSATWYYPRPDHAAPEQVSMAWAATRSENLATIWLLYHLLDQLNPEQIRRLAALTDLAPRRGEDRDAYIRRTRDDNGVVATLDRLEAGYFEAVRPQLQTDLAFSPHPEDAVEVASLHYGRGFQREEQRVRATYGGAERRARLSALGRNFLALEAEYHRCAGQVEGIRAALQAGRPPPEAPLLKYRADDGRVLCTASAPGGDEVYLHTLLEESASGDGEDSEVLPASQHILVNGVLHGSTIGLIRAAIQREEARHPDPDPWSPELLYQHPDFRRLLALRYVAGLARAMGVERDLPPALSLPLGSADVSLLEAALVYQGLLEGATWRFQGRFYENGEGAGLSRARLIPHDGSSTNIIQEIRDRRGEVIYRAVPRVEQVVSKQPGLLVLDMLANAVQWGTGRRASRLVSIGGTRVPVMGKTGTTNDYRNAAFIGFAPALQGGSLAVERALTVAAYVGYDDNREMRRGTMRVAGASGALPAWMGAVEGLAAAGLLNPGGEPPEDGLLFQPEGMTRVPVETDGGVPVGGGEATILVLAAGRGFSPWSMPQGAGPGPWDPPAVAEVELTPETPVEPEDTASGDDGAPAPAEGSDQPGSVWDRIEEELGR